MKISQLSSSKYRWMALVVLALGLAIVIIDNSVLNVAIPYILRDLNTSLDSIQWIISGYALIIATLLITVGRLGDIWGRKKVFILGLGFFAVGSFIASISQTAPILFLGEALIEAIGAAMMLTSSLSLIATEFQGRERSIAFGVWGAVAGAAASLGPLLGGYFTTYYSWRWSLRINVVVAIVALLLSVFIKEAKGEKDGRFDFGGTILSGFGLFSLIFGFIEGKKYGWLNPNEILSVGSWHWPFSQISVIPVAFALAAVLIALFILWENRLEKLGGKPLVRITLFKNRALSFGLFTVLIMALGQFGVFFIFPIYAQNVLGRDAFHTGLLMLISAGTVLVIGPLTGFLASKFNPKWFVVTGMFAFAASILVFMRIIAVDSNGWNLAPALILMGFGIGMTSAQITNIILSSAPVQFAGEISALNATMRQVGTAIGIAILGVALSSAITSNIQNNVSNDSNLPSASKPVIIQMASSASAESGEATNFSGKNIPAKIVAAVTSDVKIAITDASKSSLIYAFIFSLLGAFLAIFIPKTKSMDKKESS